MSGHLIQRSYKIWLARSRRIVQSTILPRVSGAKVSIFNACERGLKKDRAHERAKHFAVSAYRAWWQNLRQSIKNAYVISLVSPCSAAREQFPKAAAFGAFSWFVLCRAAKNEQSKPAQIRAR
jgi:hypothetical protein